MKYELILILLILYLERGGGGHPRGSLDCPENWPGSIYSSLIAVHWEVMLEFSDSDGNLIKWVEPVIIKQRDAKTVLSPAPTRSGRAELANF